MFYYCAKCANIKKVTKANDTQPCEVCGTPMQPVPAEYLMPKKNVMKIVKHECPPEFKGKAKSIKE